MDSRSFLHMHLDVRTRVGLWLLLVVAIAAGGGLILLDMTQNQLAQSSGDSLTQLVEFEQNRLAAELDEERADIETVTRDPDLFELLNPFASIPRTAEQGLEQMLEKTQQAGQDFTSFRFVHRDGSEFGQTSNATWKGENLAAIAMDRRSTQVGPAFEGSTLGLASPVVSAEGEVLGALIVETKLQPIVWLNSRYESFGETSEALVYQRLPNGTCQLLVDLRFDRSAAFSSLDGDFGSMCEVEADKQLSSGTDYRGAETLSAWSTVPGSDWGVVVKMDNAEVFALLDQIRRTMAGLLLMVTAILLVGWFAMVRPIGERLSRAASAAEQLAAGNFNAFINDPRSDEIGRMSDSMDHLARDLADDIERREQAEARLRIRADYDELTGVMNRHHATTRLKGFSDSGQDFSVIFLDLDGFKEINDTYGHSVGDEVLRIVSTRVLAAIDNADFPGELGRWGGDEFVVACPGSSRDDLEGFVDLIDSQFDHPFRTTAGEHRVGVSIGTADTTDGETLEAVMSAADAAMYRMKRRRDGRAERLSPHAIKLVEEALQTNRVVSYLQPLISLDTNGAVHLFGAEALVRIQNDDGSIESPGSFLPGLGASEQALALDFEVLRCAARATAELLRQEFVPADFYLSSNFGAAAMADPRLAEKIVSIIDAEGLAPENLIVEIPETARDVDISVIEDLRSRGVRIAIDDVGCAFSNLERLVDIPADIAKIDRRWLPNNELAGGSSKLELLQGLYDQCKMLDLDVIVEGIETETQLELVHGVGATRVQGFLFGRPVEPSYFERLWARPGGQSLRAVSTDTKQDENIQSPLAKH